MAKSAWVSGSVLIDTTSGFSSASAVSKLSNFLAPLSASGSFALVDAALAHAHDLEARNARIGERMAHAHIAEADDQNTLLLRHAFLPICQALSVRSLITLPVRADSSAASVASSAAAASSGRPIAGVLPFSAQLAK